MQGIVFNGNYLTYYDVAWTEYFRAMNMTWKDRTSVLCNCRPNGQARP
ncbi:MAG TPA: hotdog domain-containing protein, partial [Blastocatellia bacterium]|nr:hotdog domain-containing protein [Blastocatellia bacterium]